MASGNCKQRSRLHALSFYSRKFPFLLLSNPLSSSSNLKTRRFYGSVVVMYPFQSFSICFGIYFGVFLSCSFETAQLSPLKQVSNQEFDLSCHGMWAETISSQVPICRPRGRRAGLKTKAEELRKINDIPVLNSPQGSYANFSNSSPRANLNNLILIPAKKHQVQLAVGSHFVPSIMLSNPMSLSPKLSEVQELLLRQNV